MKLPKMHLTSQSVYPPSNCVAVVLVAMVMMLLLSFPSVTVGYRLDTLDDLSDLLHKNDESSEVARNPQVWRHDLPLLVNLLKSIEDWESLRTKNKGVDQQEEGSSARKSKRGRDMMYGAMPPMRELCRMMGYASCPH